MTESFTAIFQQSEACSNKTLRNTDEMLGTFSSCHRDAYWLFTLSILLQTIFNNYLALFYLVNRFFSLPLSLSPFPCFGLVCTFCPHFLSFIFVLHLFQFSAKASDNNCFEIDCTTTT